MLQSYDTESVHNVHKSKNGTFLNSYRHLAYGNFYPYLSISPIHLWTFMEEFFHNLSLGNHYQKWAFMDYGQDLHYSPN